MILVLTLILVLVFSFGLGLELLLVFVLFLSCCMGFDLVLLCLGLRFDLFCLVLFCCG